MTKPRCRAGTVGEPADSPVDPVRNRIMRAIRGRDTGPEMAVRRLAHRLGYRFRLHRRDLPGRPDLALPRHRKAVFVHGCFWHRHAGCRRSTMPATRTAYWTAKFAANVARDRRVLGEMRAAGWDVLVVWECETGNEDRLSRRLLAFLGPPGGF